MYNIVSKSTLQDMIVYNCPLTPSLSLSVSLFLFKLVNRFSSQQYIIWTIPISCIIYCHQIASVIVDDAESQSLTVHLQVFEIVIYNSVQLLHMESYRFRLQQFVPKKSHQHVFYFFLKKKSNWDIFKFKANLYFNYIIFP